MSPSTPDSIKAPQDTVQAAVQDDVNVTGLSIRSGAHGTLVPKLFDGLGGRGAKADTLILVGGIILEADSPALYEAGVEEIFGPEAPTEETVAYVQEHAPQRRG